MCSVLCAIWLLYLSILKCHLKSHLGYFLTQKSVNFLGKLLCIFQIPSGKVLKKARKSPENPGFLLSPFFAERIEFR